jgi:pimeloyl-ACP methyl ester carboxylesterase
MARSRFGAWIGEMWSGTEFLSALTRPAGNGLPHGDSSGVLLVPGFWGGDDSVFILARDLARLGYDARTWGLGVNNRCGEDSIVSLIESARVHRKRHEKPLAVIGHSRGGFMARELARRAPDLVNLVITLGTPVGARTLESANAGVHLMLRVSRAVYATRPGCLTSECYCQYVRNVVTPMPASVAAYSLWSRGDGVVVPEACVKPGEPNIEVPGSHIGMVANRDVLRLIAEILARYRTRATASL